MKEVPKKEQPDVSGGLQPDYRGGLVIPGMPSPGLPTPTYPTGPCIPMPDPTYVEK
jgi:hypothetical protein